MIDEKQSGKKGMLMRGSFLAFLGPVWLSCEIGKGIAKFLDVGLLGKC